jgi:hypothetical protein
LRLATGLLIAAYVAGHFTNHALGIVSLETLRYAGLALADVQVHRAEVRGKVRQIEVLAIDDPAVLLLPAAPRDASRP